MNEGRHKTKGNWRQIDSSNFTFLYYTAGNSLKQHGKATKKSEGGEDIGLTSILLYTMHDI